MRKFFCTALFLALGLALFAAPMRVAILGFTNDRASTNVTKQMMTRDFPAIIDENPKFELVDTKQTSSYLKDHGYDDLMVLGLEDVITIGNALQADIVIWGDILSNSATEFDISTRVLIVRSSDIKLIKMLVTTKTDARREIIKNDLFGQLEEITGGEVEKYFNIAMQHYASGNTQDAEAGFLRVLQMDPEHPGALLNLGKLKYEQNNYAEAEKYLKQALQLQPDSDDVINLLGAVYKAENKNEEAIALLADLAQRKNDPSLWLRVGNLYADMAYNDDAIRALNKALELDPSYDKPHYRLALLYFDAENYAAALPHLQFIYDMNPNDEEIYRKLAVAYQKTGRIQEAIDQYRAVIASEPNNTKAYVNLAQAYRTAAQDANGSEKDRLNQEAVNTIMQLQKIDPNNAQAPLLLSDLYISLNRYADAETSARKASELFPNMYEPYMILFQIAQKRANDTYSRLIEAEKAYEDGVRSGELIGSARDDAIRTKESLRKSANDQFRAAVDLLDKAKARCDRQNVLSDIASYRANMAQMIESTRPQ